MEPKYKVIEATPTGKYVLLVPTYKEAEYVMELIDEWMKSDNQFLILAGTDIQLVKVDNPSEVDRTWDDLERWRISRGGIMNKEDTPDAKAKG